MAGLDFLGPLGAKLEAQGDRIHQGFCKVNENLGAIANSILATRLLNERVHKAASSAKGEDVEIKNQSGWGWLVLWVANSGESEPKVYLNSENPERLLGIIGKSESGEANWYIPSGSAIFITDLTGSLNFQIEQVITSAVPANTGKGSEAFDVARPQGGPDPSILN